MPGGEVVEGIAANDWHDLCIRVLLGQESNCIDRIMRTWPVQLHIRKLKSRVIAYRQPHHSYPVLEGSNGLVLFVRGIGCHRPEYTRQLQLGCCFRSQNQVTNMGRIEGPTKQTDTLVQRFIGHIKSISHLAGMKNILVLINGFTMRGAFYIRMNKIRQCLCSTVV